ncbi:hypothetical protein [Pseudomonas sp.]|uniref:hypothetical protein n=1 Tax=Pseudomonas sp. TaxID=306 RepID=UPI003C72EEAD
MSETSVEMNDLMFAALDHAIASIENAGPLVPFTMTISKAGDNKLTRFVLEMLEQGLEAAQAHIQNEKENLKTYAIAWDGFVTIEGKKWDSIFVEAGELGTEQGVILSQRYEKKGLFKRKNLPAGNPALVERPTSKLHT